MENEKMKTKIQFQSNEISFPFNVVIGAEMVEW